MALHVKTGNAKLDAKIREWLEWDKNETTRAEILKLVEDNEVKKLEFLLLNRLSFGTAGLRGVMAAGYNRMNDLVLIQTSQGLAKYVLRVNPKVQQEGVVVGFDGRHNSHRFAKLTAAAFLNCNIPVYLYSKMVPTPYIPFGVCQYQAAVGIMVTASHNPKEDNGYKVYWSNGAQITEPHDTGIQGSIVENIAPWPNAWNTQDVQMNPLLNDPLAEVKATYYTVLEKSMVDKKSHSKCKTLFTYTPMHGVAYEYMVKAVEVCGFPPFIPVKEQIAPDPDFPTVKFPNPEEGRSALDLAMKTADEHGSTIILANDPDADRLAVAEKQKNGQWKLFTGNELGALLGWWMWQCWKRENPHASGEKVYMIASAVSSKILQAIADVEGFNFIETLTGFKWMGNKTHQLIGEGNTVLFAFEEAIGFMCGTTVLDKDGITAAMKIAELVAFIEPKGLILTTQLDLIYQKYGYHICRNSYYLCYDPPTMRKLFDRLRNFDGTPNTYPSKCGTWTISHVRDLNTAYDSSQPDKKAILPKSSSSQMITFTFSNGCVASLRTSGTEPKVKYYTEFCAKPGQNNKAKLVDELRQMVECIIEEFLQPEVNNLIARGD